MRGLCVCVLVVKLRIVRPFIDWRKHETAVFSYRYSGSSIGNWHRRPAGLVGMVGPSSEDVNGQSVVSGEDICVRAARGLAQPAELQVVDRLGQRESE